MFYGCLDPESTYRAGMKPCLDRRSNLPRCSRYVFVTLYLKRFSGYVQKDLWTFSCLWLAILLRILANPWVETGTSIQSLLHVNGFPYCYFSTEKHNLTLNTTENREVMSTCSTPKAPQIVPETTVVSVMTATDDKIGIMAALGVQWFCNIPTNICRNNKLNGHIP